MGKLFKIRSLALGEFDIGFEIRGENRHRENLNFLKLIAST